MGDIPQDPDRRVGLLVRSFQSGCGGRMAAGPLRFRSMTGVAG
jgi:hypothetical protein